MSDLISRKAAIDAILHITNCKSVRELFEYNQEHHLTEMWSGGVNDAIDAVIGVESAIDNNVGTKLSTNLASLGTDCSEFPNNSDAISRQAAIDALYSVDEYNSRSVKAIKQLPPIQPKRGRWIGKYPVSSACSECGYLINDSKVKVFAFCPNCGAKMEVTNGN